MNKTSLAWAACLVFSLVSGMPAQAQSSDPAAPAVYTQQQLDQMLAPVALYPDSLLAQVLMASTYPLEVVQAQRFVEARPGLQGDGLARAVAPMPWDPSVKALVQFPSVLAMLNDRLDWMQQLGQAFLAQQPAVMDTVQNLRERARIAGTLESSPQQRVVVQEDVIEIVPVNPQVVYVPYYNPTVVYGSWWWPSAPPLVWVPPPRYRPPSYSSGFSASISFSSGIGVMSAFFGDARPDWRQRQVLVTQTRINNITNNVTNVTNVNNTNVVNNRVVNNNVTINRNAAFNSRPVVWHHDARYGGGRFAQQQAPVLNPPARPAPVAQMQPPAQPQWREHGPQAPTFQPGQAHALPVVDNVQQRLAQQDQIRQRQAFEQQRQREQQANDQQRQREQMIRDQQHQRDQQAQEQRGQQQAQERQWQQRQQQLQWQQQQQQQMQQQMQQQHLQQQQRQQEMRQQQMMNQQREQAQRVAMEQARQQHEQAVHREPQAHQPPPPQPQREAHPRKDERRDEHS
ncbi:DUF3300 domain-containing protein [uncultured Herbaspirillum sp.]|uniref:DUF3300 domain-containing protein n=2 Tax=Herbaspirillum TaxID=963 RepID=UPI002589A468|nr:DUF3300 domain-containing protein [uncultured Herbaspirillum sp.]